jgi:hypothetical protein
VNDRVPKKVIVTDTTGCSTQKLKPMQQVATEFEYMLIVGRQN